MSEKHLKSHQEYLDRYDRHTVEICRDIERVWGKDDDSETLKNNKKITKKQATAIREWATDFRMKFATGERYLKKDQTVREWEDEDRRKDELYESAQPMEDLRCLTCRNRVKPTFKQLWYGDGKADRILFMYDCPNKCLPRRAFFSDGEEWRIKPNLCPSCHVHLDHTENDDRIKVVNTYTCKKCGYTKSDEYVWTQKKEEEIDLNFAADRDRFCLTDEEGKKFQEMKWNMEQMGRMVDEWKEKDKALAEKLKQNPKGFHLEGRRSCTICGDTTEEGDNWYDKWGIKCLVCQNAIDKAEVPASIAKNKDKWYSKYDIERAFNVKTPTLQKWIRKGIIKPRHISNYGNGVHYEFFMIEDNKDFLPPKKLVESKWVNVKEGDKIESRSVHWYQLGDPFVTLKGYKVMDYLRVVPPEEMSAREEEKKRKWEEKRARRELGKKRLDGRNKDK